MITIGVDPGLICSGYALLVNGECISLTLKKRIAEQKDNLVKALHGQSVGAEAVKEKVLADYPMTWSGSPLVAVEKPIIYGNKKARDDDVMKLMAAFGAVVTPFAFMKTLTPTPAQWKGQIPKHIHHKRILRKNPEAERFLADIPRTQHEHVLDALGLAQWRNEQEGK